jgi:hypothetical protein
MVRPEQLAKAGQLDPHQSEAAHQLDRQGAQPQRLPDLLKGARRCRVTFAEGFGQYPQIQHLMAAGPEGGGQGMDAHQH